MVFVLLLELTDRPVWCAARDKDRNVVSGWDMITMKSGVNQRMVGFEFY